MRDPSHNHAFTEQELRQLGAQPGLREFVVKTSATALPLETVLATSFPSAEMLRHVRTLLRRDASGGHDALGPKADIRDNVVWVTYPTTTIGWQRID